MGIRNRIINDIAFLLLYAVLSFVPVMAEEEGGKPLYPDEKSGGRPATVRMMVGKDGKAGEGETGYIESQIKDAVEVNEKGEIIGGKYKEREKIADDLLKNVVPKELPEPTGSGEEHIPHAYDRGTTEEEVEKNKEFDYKTILNTETFYDCMDYKIIDPVGCFKPLPKGQFVMVPYVKYHGPPQKVENVDQPLKTGYVTKENVEKIINEQTIDNYYKYAAGIAEYNIKYITAMLRFQACLLEIKPLKLSSDETRARCSLEIEKHNFKDPLEFSKKFVDDMKSGVIDKKFIYRNYDDPKNGYVFNEYHLMPTGIDLRSGRAFFQAFIDPNVLEAFIRLLIIHAQFPEYTPKYDTYVHWSKYPFPVFGDFPRWMLFSRHTGFSVGMYPEWMLEKSYDPKMCALWNRNFSDNYEDLQNASQTVQNKGLKEMLQVDSDRKLTFDNETSKNTSEDNKTSDALRGTPHDMLLGLVDSGDYNPYADVLCQGMNQGHWLPLTNRVNTPYHTVAASIGTVRAIQVGAKLYPEYNYGFTHSRPHGQPKINQDGAVTEEHDGDKVQWLRNAYMDKAENAPDGPVGEMDTKACHSIDRWVKKFGEANTKYYSDERGDKRKPSEYDEFTGGHWYVAAHWRYWRGCLDPFVEGGDPYPIGEWQKLGEFQN